MCHYRSVLSYWSSFADRSYAFILDIQHCTVRMCATKLAFHNDVFVTQRILCRTVFFVKKFACPVERFLFQMLVVFSSGEYVIQFLSYLNEAQHWSGLIERPFDREYCPTEPRIFWT